MKSIATPRKSLLAALVLAAAACSESGPVGPAAPPGSDDLPARERRVIPAPLLPNLHASEAMLATCGPAVEYKLTDMNHTIGKVSVANDAEHVYVTYSVTAADWFISDTRLAVARTYADVPQDAYGNPLPWSFPWFGEHEPVITSYTYAIPLSQLGVAPGQQVIVAAMAGVVHPTTASYEGPWEWLVMWGTNSTPGTKIRTMHAHTLATCGTQPPPPPPPASVGAFTITFDDGWTDTYTNAFPVLRELGLAGNVAVNPTAIDEQWTTYMTLPQVKALHAAGWSIVSHSLTHPDLTQVSDAEMHRQLRESKAWIERNGFGPATTFIVPFHSWGERELAAIRQYYTRARGYAVNQFYPARFTALPITTSPFEIYAYEPEFAPYTTAEGRAATIAIIERAIRDGRHVDILFHHVPTSHLPAFRELMRQVATYKANLRTWAAL